MTAHRNWARRAAVLALAVLLAPVALAHPATSASPEAQASTPAAEAPTNLSSSERLPGPEALPSPEDILDLTPEIKRFLDARVGLSADRETRFFSLQSALFGKHGLEITYGNSDTRTALETFETRTGNCLSFTLLFTAMARYLSLPAYFLEVDEVLSWDRRGEVLIGNRHMFAEVELYNGIKRVDFLPGSEKSYRHVRRIDDQRALAHFYNNRGAEILADGNAELSLVYFAKAIELDPELAAAWVNRGVALRKSGDPEAAESSYLEALDRDRGELTANTNLAALYLAVGEAKKAEPHLERAEAQRRRNPYHHFRQAIRARSRGDLDDALERLDRALQRMPKEPLFHATRGEIYAERGERGKARRSFEQALRLSEDFDQLDRLRRQLEAL